MTVKELYCYEREEGKVTVSTEKPDCDYVLRYRLIADAGKQLSKDGDNFVICVDTDSMYDWYEVDELDKSNPIFSDEISPSEFMALVEEAL